MTSSCDLFVNDVIALLIGRRTRCTCIYSNSLILEEEIGLYAARLRTIVFQLRDAGHPLEDLYQAFQLIRYLPESYQGIVQSIYRWDNKDFKFEHVLSELLAEENSQGIEMEITNTYSPEINGVGERFNYTTLDAIGAMLRSSGLSNKFWSEALLCFTYTWNRICHKNQTKPPF
ncbi:retrovirus-related Pol polyprotein from transposon TNT 1-94 [Trichonephila clavipes]|nr:retrovirus-related Pol polyprotein from transposon TNT 1-94 [Trichonephila clavipes]